MKAADPREALPFHCTQGADPSPSCWHSKLMGTGMPKDAEAPKLISSLTSYSCHASSSPPRFSSASMPTAKPIQSKTGQPLDHSEALKRKQQNDPRKGLTSEAQRCHKTCLGQPLSTSRTAVRHVKRSISHHRYHVPSQMSPSSLSSSWTSRCFAYSGRNVMKGKTNQEHENFILCQENLLVSLQ